MSCLTKHLRPSQRLMVLALALNCAFALAQSAPEYGALVSEGVQARDRKDFRGAIDLLSTARSLLPADPRATLELAVTYEFAGRLPDAERTYREQLAVEPGNAGAALGLGRVLRWRWRFDEALASYRQVIESSQASGPMRREAELGIAQIDRLEMRLEPARVRLQEMLRPDGGDAEVLVELDQLERSVRDRLQLTIGERRSPFARSATWLAAWSSQVDAGTAWKAGVARNTAGQPTLATDVPVNDVHTLWFAEGRQFVPMGRALWGRAEWRQMTAGSNQYQLQGEWSDQLMALWRANAGVALSGPQAATRRTVSGGLSHQFLPNWDAGVTAYAANGGPAAAQRTWLTRVGYERDGVLAQLFVSKSVGQSAATATGVLQLPLPRGYQLRMQASRDGVARVNAWSVGLVVPFGQDVGLQFQHDRRNDERAWSLGADVAIRHPPFQR